MDMDDGMVTPLFEVSLTFDVQDPELIINRAYARALWYTVAATVTVFGLANAYNRILGWIRFDPSLSLR